MSLFLYTDPFAVKRNVARTVSSQQMYEYILHCLKTTYKYFALPLNTPAASLKTQAQRKGANAKALNEEIVSDFNQLSLQSQHANQPAEENGPEDSDCIIEEEEEVEEYSDSDEERGKEKVDLGKSSLSEDEEDDDVDIDVDTCNRHHLDSFTTEEEEIFPVDEISGEELLSDEEGPDLDTPGSVDEDEEEEVELAPVNLLAPLLEDATKDGSPENKTPKQRKLSYEFTRQAFTRGKVGIGSCFVFILQTNICENLSGKQDQSCCVRQQKTSFKLTWTF